MTESEFNQRVDDIFIQLEDALDECDVDIDFESTGGILTLIFENGTQIIVNRQTPVQQIWVAARSGGFHFDFRADDEQWILQDSDKELFSAISQYATEQAGESVSLTAQP